MYMYTDTDTPRRPFKLASWSSVCHVGKGGGAGGAQGDPIQPDVHVRTCRSAVITCVEELRSSTVLANGRLTCICMPRKEAFDWTHFEQVSSVGEPKGARKV